MESLHVNLGCKLVNGVCNPEGIVTSLTALTRLRSLQLTDEYGNTSSMISPTIQRKFETKFTQLEELRLPRASAASISEIHSLVSHLPNLRTLGINISLNKMPPCDALPPLLHSLSTLSVGHSDAIHERDQAKLMAVSRHLYRMFPYLKEIEYDQAPSWERVSKMLSFIRIVVTDHAELPIIRREKAEAKRRRSSTIREWYNWMVKG
ncbi:hypothetical protein AX16_009079 [Volvariella volvacea WC 439]|nr:hypothetical protein AX16_009079 [Volvariella volvacea WC 439]